MVGCKSNVIYYSSSNSSPGIVRDICKHTLFLNPLVSSCSKYTLSRFIFNEFTVGLDLFYNINGDIKEKTDGITTAKFGSYNEYGFNVDANYALTEDNNYVGLYFAMAQSDIKGPKDSAQQYKEPTEYKFGLKFVSEF